MSLKQAQIPRGSFTIGKNKMLHPGMEPKFQFRGQSVNKFFSLFKNENYTKIQE